MTLPGIGHPHSLLVAVFAVLVSVSGPALASPIAEAIPAARQDREEENRRLVQDAFDRWAAGGSDFFDEIVDEAVVWTIEGSGPSAATHRGRAAFVERAVRPFAARMSSPNRPVFTRLWADGDHVIVNWIGEGVAADGAPYRNTYVWVFRMRDGRAVEVNAFLDLPAYDDLLRRVPGPPVAGLSR